MEQKKNQRRKIDNFFSVSFSILLLIVIICFGCNEGKTTTKQTSKGGEVRTETGIFIQVRELKEFDYKGHTYISCDVRDGIALTHAGHCWCNSIRK